MKTLLYLFAIVIICSCQNHHKDVMRSDVVLDSGEKKISKTEVDNFIKDYQNKDFSEFKNLVICTPSKSSTKTIYTINRSDENLPMYFVDFDESKDKITGVINPGLEQQKTKDCLTKEQIGTFIKYFRNLNFYFLSVDDDNNVYLNPFCCNHLSCLIRLNKTSKFDSLKMDRDFKYYQGNWYINRAFAAQLY